MPIEGLRNELAQRGNLAYLLTVSDEGRPHCVAVSVGWDDVDLTVASGRTSVANAHARPHVTLLVPPSPTAPAASGPDVGNGPAEQGYSLIVDGDVAATAFADEGGGTVRFRPTHAVLHRPAVAPDGGAVHDCVPVYDSPSPNR